MEQFHFLVGEFKKNSPFIPAAASAQLFSWFEQVSERVDRYGSKTGKVVKFSQRNDEKTLFAPDANSMELFSLRVAPPPPPTIADVRSCRPLDAVHRTNRWPARSHCLLRCMDQLARSASAREVRKAASNSTAALAMNVLWYPLLSNSKPPIVEPRAMASCTTATINPPPSSASRDSIIASQDH